ncbi:hypothetical protein B9Z19DRAFT_1109681 [Tuber borchii]|uniref:Uncharacterized protein n=1 Tax=Tuber borchii TaxID=42251 RepID=A0A2T6ZKQ3_TUBBO|nr:hypothetical protein B9Z19DRAFT_1109681 [Tuber borchii]
MFADSAAFRELEAKWFNRFPSLRNALLRVLHENGAMSFKHFEEEQVKMFKYLEGQTKCFQNENTVFLKHFKAKEKRQDKEVKELIMQNCDLIDAALQERTKRMKSEAKYNVRGALARMVYFVKLQKKVPPTASIQQGLDWLAKQREFITVLHKEVQIRQLCAKEVMACVNRLHEVVSNHTNGNDDAFNDIVIVRAAKFSDNEGAALVIFLKVQSNWPNPVNWREDTSEKGGE